MWIFRHKKKCDCCIDRYKTQLLGDSYDQQTRVKHGKTFSPIVKLATIQTILIIILSKPRCFHQLDVKNIFLQKNLDEIVYMHQPPSFRDPKHPDYVCLLYKSLYDLKQALHA